MSRCYNIALFVAALSLHSGKSMYAKGDAMNSTPKIARALSITAAFLTLLIANPVAAQQPTQAERDAIRASCRSDFMTNCSGVTPGGKEALDCLIQNEAKLSSSCRTAVSAVAPKPAAPTAAEPAAPRPATAVASPEAPPAAAAPPAEEGQLKAIQQACTLNDFMAHCSWIKPSSPEVVLCLKANAAELSPACRAAVEGIAGHAAPAAAQAPSAVPPAPAPPPKAAAKKTPTPKRAAAEPSPSVSAGAGVSAPPTAQQQSAIRAACRSDFMSHCSGVTPGGAEALQCLKRNAAQLSPACHSAVAAIGGGGSSGAGAAETPGPSAAAPAVAPLTLPPFIRPRKRFVIMAICDANSQRLCRGTSPLGGEILHCLAANASALSPNCYEALAHASRE